jgi:hypothetical protein
MLRDYVTKVAGPGCGEIGNPPRWRYHEVGILSELAEREEERSLHGYEPLRFKRERTRLRMLKKEAWCLNHRGWRRLGAIHMNYGGWIPVSDPIKRLRRREYQNHNLWELVFLACPSRIKKRRRADRMRGLHSKVDYLAERSPPWRPWSTTWVRLKEMQEWQESITRTP